MIKCAIILCLCILVCSINAQSNGTCNPIKNQASCESAGCYFCSNKCRVSAANCPGGGETVDGDTGGDTTEDEEDITAPIVSNGNCNPIKVQTECESTGCFFCTDKNKCRVSEDRCSGDDEDEEADADTDTDIGGGAQNGTCNPIKEQTECESSGCVFCTDKNNCRASDEKCKEDGTDTDTDTGGGAQNGVCNPIKVQIECESAGCFFCTDKNKCRVSEDRCSDDDEDGGNGIDTDTSTGGGAQNGTCNPIKEQIECESAGCVFCTDKNKCRVSDEKCKEEDEDNGQGNGLNSNRLCNPIKDETSCTDAGCFFCSDKGLCRPTESKCPGGGAWNAFGLSQCFPFKGDEDGCTNAGCFFCGGSSAHCRLDEAECPGLGRGNPCKDLVEGDCSTSEDCLWCPESNLCTSARGGSCTTTAGVPPGNQCKQFTTDTECTDGETTNCRWCPDNSKCKNADDACDDGGGGVRANPCNNALSSDGCTSIEGCLWCEGNSKCKTAEDGCEDADEDDEDGDGDTSNLGPDEGEEVEVQCVAIWQADCEAEPNVCQWCPDQAVCKAADADCTAASSAVAFELDYETPAFSLRNSGLGKADPNAVQVSLNYLFEVAEDKTEIPMSFVDVQNQKFMVAQTEGIYNGVLSRKATFTTDIAGVGNVELVVYKILKDGTVSIDSGETFDVRKGDVKFNVNLSNWSYCDESTGICADSGSAAFIDIAMTVKGSADVPEQDETDGTVFNLGGGVPFILSNQVQIDGVTDAMPIGFPRVEETDTEGTFFVFRFPRFSNTLVYDPIVGSGKLIVSDDATTLAPTAGPTNLRSGDLTSSGAHTKLFAIGPLVLAASSVLLLLVR